MSRQIILDIPRHITPILADELHRFRTFAFHTNTLLFRQLIVMQSSG